MESEVDEAGVTAFCEAHVVPDFETGVLGIAQATGVGELSANTVMFGWTKDRDRLSSQLRLMRALANAGKSTIICRLNWAHEPGQEKRIDLWWGGLQNNGDLMLLLAHLLRLNSEWIDARLTVRSIARSEAERDSQHTGLAELLAENRIEADTEVLFEPDPDRDVAEILHERSAKADVVFLGLMIPSFGDEVALRRTPRATRRGLQDHHLRPQRRPLRRGPALAATRRRDARSSSSDRDGSGARHLFAAKREPGPSPPSIGCRRATTGLIGRDRSARASSA